MPKSLKQLTTHCSISSPSTSSALTVDNSTPGFVGQQISILVFPSSPRFSTSNCADQPHGSKSVVAHFDPQAIYMCRHVREENNQNCCALHRVKVAKYIAIEMCACEYYNVRAVHIYIPWWSSSPSSHC